MSWYHITHDVKDADDNAAVTIATVITDAIADGADNDDKDNNGGYND